jgi:hypothetical protein
LTEFACVATLYGGDLPLGPRDGQSTSLVAALGGHFQEGREFVS